LNIQPKAECTSGENFPESHAEHGLLRVLKTIMVFWSRKPFGFRTI
jgi:hypothetical protein